MPEASVQFKSEVQGILPVAPGEMTREPVHCDLKNGGLLDDFTSENRSVMPELFVVRKMGTGSESRIQGS
jgi:hypothetical protein